MRIRWASSALFACLLSLGVGVVGCDILTGGQKKEEEEEDEGEEEKAEADEKSDDAGSSTREDYIKASVEISCVDMKLGDNDNIDMDNVKEDVLGQYGFDEDSFEEAEKKFEEDDEVKMKVGKQLDKCDKEQAKKIAGLIDEEEEKEKEKEQKKKPQPDPEPAATGSFDATVSGRAQFEKAILSITITEDFEVSGSLRGKREGKGFRVPFEGTVSKSNKISASGSDGGNSVNVSGDVTSSGASVQLSGSIWKKNFSLSMNAR